MDALLSPQDPAAPALALVFAGSYGCTLGPFALASGAGAAANVGIAGCIVMGAAAFGDVEGRTVQAVPSGSTIGGDGMAHLAGLNLAGDGWAYLRATDGSGALFAAPVTLA